MKDLSMVDTTSKDLTLELAKANGQSPYLNTRQAAKFLGLSTEWLQLQRSKGIGPAYSQLGDARDAPILYAVVDLVDYIMDHMVRTAQGGV